MTVCTADRQECGQSTCPICSQKNGLHSKDVADRNLLGVGTGYGYCISDYLRMICPYSLLTTSEINRAENGHSHPTRAPNVQKKMSANGAQRLFHHATRAPLHLDAFDLRRAGF